MADFHTLDDEAQRLAVDVAFFHRDTLGSVVRNITLKNDYDFDRVQKLIDGLTRLQGLATARTFNPPPPNHTPTRRP